MEEQRVPEGPATTKPCAHCGGPVAPRIGAGGRPKVYCSARCRHAAANARKPRKGPPRNRPRRPLPDFVRDTAWALRKDVERLERAFSDDRFRANEQQVATIAGGHLKYAAEVCQDLLRRLNQDGE